MTWHELFTALERADPANEVVVVLYRLQGAPEVFALEEARDTGEYVRLAIYEEEPVAQVREDDTEG
jgi:hypothetical protein